MTDDTKGKRTPRLTLKGYCLKSPTAISSTIGRRDRTGVGFSSASLFITHLSQFRINTVSPLAYAGKAYAAA